MAAHENDINQIYRVYQRSSQEYEISATATIQEVRQHIDNRHPENVFFLTKTPYDQFPPNSPSTDLPADSTGCRIVVINSEENCHARSDHTDSLFDANLPKQRTMEFEFPYKSKLTMIVRKNDQMIEIVDLLCKELEFASIEEFSTARMTITGDDLKSSKNFLSFFDEKTIQGKATRIIKIEETCPHHDKAREFSENLSSDRRARDLLKNLPINSLLYQHGGCSDESFFYRTNESIFASDQGIGRSSELASPRSFIQPLTNCSLIKIHQDLTPLCQMKSKVRYYDASFEAIEEFPWCIEEFCSAIEGIEYLINSEQAPPTINRFYRRTDCWQNEELRKFTTKEAIFQEQNKGGSKVDCCHFYVFYKDGQRILKLSGSPLQILVRESSESRFSLGRGKKIHCQMKKRRELSSDNRWICDKSINDYKIKIKHRFK